MNHLHFQFRTVLLAGFLLITAPGFLQAQTPSKLTDLKDPAAKYANTIRETDLQAHLKFLASDELEGRETTERGQKIAMRYIAAQFQRFDLLPGMITPDGTSWFQSFKMEKLTFNSADLTFDGKSHFKPIQDFISFDKADLAGMENLEFVYAGYGITDSKYDNYAGLDVKGKAVIVLDGEPINANGYFLLTGTEQPSDWEEDSEMKTELAEKYGAKAILHILPQAAFERWSQSNWVKNSLNGPSYKMVPDQPKEEIRSLYVSENMASSLLKAGKLTFASALSAANLSAKVNVIDFKKLKFQLVGDVTQLAVTGENVLGFLEGTDLKDEIVVLTAHYDHIGIVNGLINNGADDDGSGTVTILEMAEAFSKAAADGFRPRRSILFMTVSGEEKGLLGSGYYSDHPVYPLEKTVVDLNTDMIGRVDPPHAEKGVENFVYIIGSDKLSSDLHTINEKMNADYTQMELDYTYNSPDDPNRFYYRSDHYNFAKHNIPVIFYFNGTHADYHRPTDDEDKIHYPKLALTAKLIFLTAWEIANRNERLKVDKVSDFKEER